MQENQFKMIDIEGDLELAFEGNNAIEKLQEKISSLKKSIEKLTQELEENEPEPNQEEIEKLKEQIKKLQDYLKSLEMKLEKLEKEEKPDPKPEPKPENNQLQELNREFKEEYIVSSTLTFIIKKKIIIRKSQEEQLEKIFSIYANSYCAITKLIKEYEITIEINSLIVKEEKQFEVQYTIFDDKANKITDIVLLNYEETWI